MQTLASYRPTLQLRGGWQPVKAQGHRGQYRHARIGGGGTHGMLMPISNGSVETARMSRRDNDGLHGDLGLKFTLESVGEFTHSVALRELS